MFQAQKVSLEVFCVRWIFHYSKYLNSELQHFHSLIFMLSKFPVHSESGLLLPIPRFHKPQWSRGMEEFSGLMEEWHPTDVQWRCVMHMASSSAPHRMRPGDVGPRAHSQVHLLISWRFCPKLCANGLGSQTQMLREGRWIYFDLYWKCAVKQST